MKQWWKVFGAEPKQDHELLLGSQTASILNVMPGDSLQIQGETFKVSGVLDQTGSQDDSLIFAPLAKVQRLLHKEGKITLVEVAALCSGCPIGAMVNQLAELLPEAKVTAIQQVVAARLKTLDQFRRFSYAIVGVVIAIEALVVFITVMGSVSERTREIGVFRAIGFRQVHITRLILIEAVIASTVAGVLGYAAGMAITYIALPLVAHSAEVAWAPLLGVAAVVLAVAIGGLASLYPALHAGKMDPTEALRAL